MSRRRRAASPRFSHSIRHFENRNAGTRTGYGSHPLPNRESVSHRPDDHDTDLATALTKISTQLRQSLRPISESPASLSISLAGEQRRERASIPNLTRCAVCCSCSRVRGAHEVFTPSALQIKYV